MTNGLNVVERKSHEFTSTVGDHASFKEMLYQVEKGNWFVKDIDTSCGFPDRLVLPMGHMDGMPYSLFVMVTPYGAESYSNDEYSGNAYAAPVYSTNVYNTVPVKDVIQDTQYGYPYTSQYPSNVAYPKAHPENTPYHAPYSCNGLMTAIDSRPLGYPFDREIRSFNQFYTPNMYFKDVYVYHKNSTEFKYGFYNYAY